MAKIRTVKPELFRHEDLFEAEKKYELPLRLAFIGLFTCCDREGRFRWTPRALKLDVLPYDDHIDFTQVLDALNDAGFIKKYEYEGKCYGYIPSWHHHQSINKHEPISKLPDPAQSSFQPSQNTSNTMLPSSVIQSQAITTADAHKNISPLPEQAGTATSSMLSEESIAIKETIKIATSITTPIERQVKKSAVEKPPKKSVILYQQDIPYKSATVLATTRQSIIADEIITVFQHWKTTLHHPQAILDKKRHRIIQQALQSGYSVDHLCEAISGCALTPYNLGDNDRCQRFDGLHIILGNADQIDRFIGNFKYPPKSSSGLDKRMQSNVNHLQNWLDKKMHAAVYEQHVHEKNKKDAIHTQEQNINGIH